MRTIYTMEIYYEQTGKTEFTFDINKEDYELFCTIWRYATHDMYPYTKRRYKYRLAKVTKKWW